MSTMDRPSSRQFPTYFVTARHGTRGHAAAGESGSLPVGEQHARTPGSAYTACGRAAADWSLFWELPFPAEPSATCRHCMIVCANHRLDAAVAECAGGAR
jgi:hypothetical protein